MTSFPGMPGLLGLDDIRWPRLTERLLIRRAQADDASRTWPYRRRDDVGQWLPMLPTTESANEEIFRAPRRLATTLLIELRDSGSAASSVAGPGAAADAEADAEADARAVAGAGADATGDATAGRVIGDLKIDVVDAWAQFEIAEAAKGLQAEIGWALDPDYQGHGYATEAVREVIRIAFTDLGLRRITAYCFAENEPSWRLMERVGMRREAYTVADALHRDGTWRDGVVYALLADEWRSDAAG